MWKESRLLCLQVQKLFYRTLIKMEGKETFMYFSYGSNLLQERLQIRNPTAEFICNGKLQGYKFLFERPLGLKPENSSWKGAPATIRPATEEDVVYGCIWKLHVSDLPNLDRQEKFYDPIYVDVEAETGEIIQCRTYEMHQETVGSDKPSPFYKHVVLEGAYRNNFPDDYLDYIGSLPHNDVVDVPKVYSKVNELIDEFQTEFPGRRMRA